MKIAICMKCVPSDLAVGINNSTGGIDRTAANSRINQADIFALETAIKLRKEHGGRIDVYTMGPAFAETVLREALALGADQAVLICDRAMAGSDTFSTSAVLSAAIGSDYDLVLCGERTVDGETGQVPGQLSARLGFSFSSGVTELQAGENFVLCRRLEEYSEDTVRLPLPAVVGVSCGMTGVNHPLRPSLKGIQKARQAEIRRLDGAALGLSEAEIGSEGSPTRVRSVTVPDWSRRCRILRELSQGLEISREMIDESK